MKKSILILLLFVSSVGLLNAHNAFGVKAGINVADLSGFSGRSRISGHGGLFLHHTINENWCFQPELLFSGEGQRYFSNGVEHTLALDYIQLLLMIQYYVVPQFYLEAGPQVGVLISAQDKADESDGHLNVKEDFSSAQVALGIGLGYKASRQVIIYGRYNFGLTDVTKFDNIVDHSQVGQLGIAIRFNH